MSWTHLSGSFDLASPVIMGVLNVTPDSFSDGGRFVDVESAVRRGEELIEEGADLIDVGGESTRPGADPVDPAMERARVIPVVQALATRFNTPISVDTRRARIAEEALGLGASIVNDVSGLGDPAMGSVVASSGAGIVLMHMRGTPQTMQDEPRYDDVVGEVRSGLKSRLEAALSAGIGHDRIAVDPGIGFGKTFTHNLELVAGLEAIGSLGRPVVLGVSRKAFLGALIGGAPPAERAVATAAACVAGLFHGARVFRVHDVKIVREALQVAEAIRTFAPPTTGSCSNRSAS